MPPRRRPIIPIRNEPDSRLPAARRAVVLLAAPTQRALEGALLERAAEPGRSAGQGTEPMSAAHWVQRAHVSGH